MNKNGNSTFKNWLIVLHVTVAVTCEFANVRIKNNSIKMQKFCSILKNNTRKLWGDDCPVGPTGWRRGGPRFPEKAPAGGPRVEPRKSPLGVGPMCDFRIRIISHHFESERSTANS